MFFFNTSPFQFIAVIVPPHLLSPCFQTRVKGFLAVVPHVKKRGSMDIHCHFKAATSLSRFFWKDIAIVDASNKNHERISPELDPSLHFASTRNVRTFQDVRGVL